MTAPSISYLKVYKNLMVLGIEGVLSFGTR